MKIKGTGTGDAGVNSDARMNSSKWGLFVSIRQRRKLP